MTIQFLGAAQTVTGSMHLLTTDAGTRILLDCGLYQGRRQEAFEINRQLPVDPSEIDVLILSHAHIDHSGNLPSLVHGDRSQRFTAPIYCTHATRDLCSIMLPDSARIQESDAEFLRRHNRHVVGPLYTLEDALEVLEAFVSIPYRKPVQVAPDVQCTFYDAGHILGSALVVLDIDGDNGPTRFCFTGDLGRPNRPILRDPEPIGDVDFLVTESTYGGRRHESFPNLLQELRRTITETTQRGGRVIIPAFAVGRTQDIVYILNVLFERGELPRIPIYVDSPLAVNATGIFRGHPECFNKDVARLLQTDPDPFGFRTLRYIRDASESKALNDRNEPAVIISASGMMEAGRIQHHLMHSIEDERNTILIMGFQAEHTLGRRIVERQPSVRIMGGEFKLRAEVKTINGLSAHADHHELLAYIGALNRDRLRRIFLVHGEMEAAKKLKQGLHEQGHKRVDIPARFESHDL